MNTRSRRYEQVVSEDEYDKYERSRRFKRQFSLFLVLVSTIFLALIIVLIATGIGSDTGSSTVPIVIRIENPAVVTESTAAPGVAIASSTATNIDPNSVPDASCTVANIVLGSSVCTNPLNGTVFDDTLFNPNAEIDLGLCTVPFGDRLSNQFVSVNNNFNIPHLFKIVQSSEFSDLAPIVASSNGPMSIVATQNQTSYAMRAEYLNSAAGSRQCSVTVLFDFLHEKCDCVTQRSVTFNEVCFCDDSSSTAIAFDASSSGVDSSASQVESSGSSIESSSSTIDSSSSTTKSSASTTESSDSQFESSAIVLESSIVSKVESSVTSGELSESSTIGNADSGSTAAANESSGSENDSTADSGGSQSSTGI